MKLFKPLVLSILAIWGASACAPSENLASNDELGSSSIFPTWYLNVEFTSDSVEYKGFATAIASDSIKAIERADKQARIHLEKRIAQLTEEIRTDLLDSGSRDVENADFIIILRAAHYNIEEAASTSQMSSRKIDGYFRGFSSVSITKSEIKSVLENGFTGHPRYWGEFSSSPSFSKYF